MPPTSLVRQVAPSSLPPVCRQCAGSYTGYDVVRDVTRVNQDERRVSYTTPVSEVLATKAPGKTSRSSDIPLEEVVQRFRGTPNMHRLKSLQRHLHLYPRGKLNTITINHTHYIRYNLIQNIN